MSSPTSSQVRPHCRLLLELVVVVLIKLVLLAALWWMFIREHRVDVQAGQPALPWLNERPATEGATHDQ